MFIKFQLSAREEKKEALLYFPLFVGLDYMYAETLFAAWK